MTEVLIEEDVFETKDLYYAAYLLVKGNTLTDAHIAEQNHRKYVVFLFKGSGVLKNAHEFISGRAKANINELRGHINHLKRLVYETINKN